MENSLFFDRWQYKSLEKNLKLRKVIVISGARQCGKTTFAKNFAAREKLVNEEIIYRTLDNITILNAANSDPQGFVEHSSKLMIIDEIQRAPQLLQAIKENVDNNPEKGRFLLTGSSNLRSLPNANESLAGRIKIINLRTLSMGEIKRNQAVFIDNAFNQQFNIDKSQDWNKRKYLELAFKGGYPEMQSFTSNQDVQEWHRDYIQSLVDKDLQDITNIRKKDSMFKLLNYLAAGSSKILDLSRICSALSLVRTTIESYINALETMYIIDRVEPWSKTDYGRVSKKDKLFMADTGIMASILNWNLPKVELDSEKNGKLIETFVYTQLKSIIDASPTKYDLSHYRDRENREIDFLIENEDNDFLGIEVKSGTSINSESFKHLKWFKENQASKSKFTGIILYSGNEIVSFGTDLWAVPINSLWS